MNSILLICILFITCVAVTFGNLAHGSYYNPKYPGKCTISEDLILSKGDIAKNPDSCGEIRCGKAGHVSFVTCAVETLPEGCKHEEYKDKNLPYPDCCERRVICILP